MGSDPELPELRQLMAMTGTLELRDWLSAFDVQTNVIHQNDDHNRESQARIQEHDHLGELVIEAERSRASLEDLELRIADLEFELAEMRPTADVLPAEAQALAERLMRGQQLFLEPLSSPSSWLTRPLWSAKQLFGR